MHDLESKIFGFAQSFDSTKRENNTSNYKKIGQISLETSITESNHSRFTIKKLKRYLSLILDWFQPIPALTL